MVAEVDGKEFALIATHPLPPVSPRTFSERNQQLGSIASEINAIKTPKILIGDLNVTMWSHYYTQLERTTSMTNTRTGFGVLPTWPERLPLLSIPIDHCLVSKEFEVVDMRIGPEVGSDHRPIIVELAF